MKKTFSIKKAHLFLASKGIFWFLIGASLALFFLISFTFIIFQRVYWNKVYPGVIVYGVDFGGKTQVQVDTYFESKNIRIKNSTFTLTADAAISTISAQQLHLGYDSALLSSQAYSIGRSSYLFSNIVLIFQAYMSGVRLPPSYYYNADMLSAAIAPLIQQVNKQPIDGIFTMQNNRVTAFRPSVNGQAIDSSALKQKVFSYIPFLVTEAQPEQIHIAIPIQIVKPNITRQNANTYGIQDLLGEGTSFFQHSIPERVYNVTLAASKINGILVAPGEIFSFDKALGDVSKFTGYQQAYVIQDGKTVMGDGGGVCQVSTTFFRALLNAGLPIVERNAHAYRVGYYEEGGYPPGIDATIFVPTVDLKFKNDTGDWILIQTNINTTTLELTVDLYGIKDGRIATVSTPVITNQTPAPPPVYQDDPTLPNGIIKQIDFAAAGANVVFTRLVTKNGKVLYNDTFKSNYQAWQAKYLKGTKS